MAAAGSLAFGAGTAEASVGFGVEFGPLDPDTTVPDGTHTQLSTPIPNVAANVMSGPTSPVDGVIVAVLLKYIAPSAPNRSLSFFVLSGDWTDPTGPLEATSRPAGYAGSDLLFQTSPPAQYRTDSAVLTYRPGQERGRLIGVPIKAGERLAIHEQASVGGTPLPEDGFSYVKGNAGNQYTVGSNNAAQYPNGRSATYAPTAGQVVLLRAVVEGDVDKDSLGDETQDQCVGIKNDAMTLACPGAGATPPAPAPIVVTDERCRVPSVKGLTKSTARRVLEAASCKLGQSRSKSIKKGKVGVVASQGVKAGSVLAKGSAVPVTITKRKR